MLSLLVGDEAGGQGQLQGNDTDGTRSPGKEDASAFGRKASGSHNNDPAGEMYPVRVLDTFRITDYW